MMAALLWCCLVSSQSVWAGTSANLQIHMLYLRLSNGYWQIWWTDTKGIHKQITTDPLDKTRMSWSPDRKSILYNGNSGEVFIFDLNSRKVDKLNLPFTGMFDAQWSPDGEWISFSLRSTQEQDNNDLWIADKSGRNVRKILDQPGVANLASWTSDARRLAYTLSNGKDSHHLWRIDLSKNSIEQLTTGNANFFDPTFSPENQLAFATDKSGNYDIWMLENGSKHKRLTQHEAYDAQPTWSPSTNEIAFYSQRNGQRRIWIKNLDTGVSRPVTPENVTSRNPVWY